MFRIIRLLLKLLAGFLVFFLITSVLAVAAYRWLPVKVTPLMLIRSWQHRGERAYTDWQHTWVPLDSISPYLPVAVMASEDQNFPRHNGFDVKAILEAQLEYERGGRRRGASTISQQTAKNVFLWPESSWLRKGLEAYFTVLIEAMWSKTRIMEVYLNSIEMGPGLYGAEAVAQSHFDCTASRLTRSDCALIAATLPNPIRYSSLKPSKYMRRRQLQIQRQMKHINFLSVELEKQKYEDKAKHEKSL